MSTTVIVSGVGTAGGGATASGRPAQGHVFYGPDSGAWWVAYLAGTQNLAFVRSGNGTTWSSGGSVNLLRPHAGEPRNFGLHCVNVGGVDALHVTASYPSGDSPNQTTVSHLRIALVNQVLGDQGFQATVTNAEAVTATSTTAATGPSGATTLLAASGTSGHVIVGNPFLDAGSGPGGFTVTRSTSADTGASWTAGFDSPSTLNAAGPRTATALAGIGGDSALAVMDNAASAGTFTDLIYAEYNGTGWVAGSSSALGTTLGTAQDTNDWDLAAVTATDVHLVTRTGSDTFLHRRASVFGLGLTWGAGQAIPAQTTAAGAGLFLVTDGTMLWLFAIDGSNNLLVTRWSGGFTPGWTAWSTVESGGTAARTALTGGRTVVNGQILLVWTEANGTDHDLVGTVYTVAFPVTGAGALPALAAAGTANEAFPVAGGGALAAPLGAGSANLVRPVAGGAGLAAPAAAAAVTATAVFPVMAAGSVPSPAGAAALGTVLPVNAAAGLAAPAAIAAVGTVRAVTAAGTLAAPAASAALDLVRPITAAGVLAAPVPQAAAGTILAVTGSAALTAPAATASIGSVFAAAAALTLAGPAGTAGLDTVLAVTAGVPLAGPAAAAALTTRLPVTAAVGLPAPAAAATAAAAWVVTAAAGVPGPAGLAAAGLAWPVTGTANLPAPAAAALLGAGHVVTAAGGLAGPGAAAAADQAWVIDGAALTLEAPAARADAQEADPVTAVGALAAPAAAAAVGLVNTYPVTAAVPLAAPAPAALVDLVRAVSAAGRLAGPGAAAAVDLVNFYPATAAAALHGPWALGLVVLAGAGGGGGGPGEGSGGPGPVPPLPFVAVFTTRCAGLMPVPSIRAGRLVADCRVDPAPGPIAQPPPFFGPTTGALAPPRRRILAVIGAVNPALPGPPYAWQRVIPGNGSPTLFPLGDRPAVEAGTADPADPGYDPAYPSNGSANVPEGTLVELVRGYTDRDWRFAWNLP